MVAFTCGNCKNSSRFVEEGIITFPKVNAYFCKIRLPVNLFLCLSPEDARRHRPIQNYRCTRWASWQWKWTSVIRTIGIRRDSSAYNRYEDCDVVNQAHILFAERLEMSDTLRGIPMHTGRPNDVCSSDC